MDTDMQIEETVQIVADPPASVEPAPSPSAQQAKNESAKSEEKAQTIPSTTEREPGKSLLPLARVQKILKADKELPPVAKEASFLISLATEQFIQRLAKASQVVAKRENRVTIQYKDIASVARRADEFLFLEEILPWADVSSAPKRRNLKADVEKETDQTTLDDKLKKKSEEDSVALVRGSPEDLETPRDRDAEDEGGTAASA